MVRQNIAMQLQNWLGVAALYRNTAPCGKSKKYTKSGPGRIHQQGKIKE